MMVLLLTAVISGCDAISFSVTKLETPVITINNQASTLEWQSINKADEYDIFLNDKVIGRVKDGKTNTQSYNFASHLSDYGSYRFKVRALSSNEKIKNSTTSISKSLIHRSSNYTGIQQEYNVEYNVAAKSPKDVQLTNGELTWSLVNDASYYVVTTFTISKGVTNYKVMGDTLSYSFEDLYKDEIVAFSVGAYFEESDTLYIQSKERNYYNPDTSSYFTNNIYTFDGYIGDYYIQNMEELINITYYNFINRKTNYQIRIADSFMQDVGIEKSSWLATNKIIDKINYCFAINSGPFFETCHFTTGYANSFAKHDTDFDFTIKVNFNGVDECDVDLYSSDYGYHPLAQSSIQHAYYDTFTSENDSRESDYNDFVSDKYFVTKNVTTSEELYWAVENNVTPLPAPNSRADIIYTKAKEVLIDIIHPKMTDYEKALSIFDWVTINTVYDNANIAKMFEETERTNNPIYYTKSPAYYLEGVFMQGIAVCDGFSKAFSLLSNMEGIDCIRITGYANNGAHAWNKILIDGNYYLVDITWTELKTDPVGKNKGTEYLSHKYFLLSDSFLTTHKAHAARDKFFDYPTAKYNYNYYAATNYTFTNNNKDDLTVNLVVNSDEDLSNLMEYFFVTNTQSADVIFTEKYISDVNDREGVGSGLNPNVLKEVILEKTLSKQKSVFQMLSVVADYPAMFYKFDNSGSTREHRGMVVYLQINMLLQSDEHAKNFIELINQARVFNDINTVFDNFYITKDVLGSYDGTVQEKLDGLIADLNLSYDVEMVYSGVSREVDFYNSGLQTLYQYTLTF